MEKILSKLVELGESQGRINESQRIFNEKATHNTDLLLKFLEIVASEKEESDSENMRTLRKKGGLSLYFTCPGFNFAEHVIIVTLPGDEMEREIRGKYIISVPSLSWSCCVESWSSDHHFWEGKLRPVADPQRKEYEVPYIAQALANFEP